MRLHLLDMKQFLVHVSFLYYLIDFLSTKSSFNHSLRLGNLQLEGHIHIDHANMAKSAML